MENTIDNQSQLDLFATQSTPQSIPQTDQKVLSSKDINTMQVKLLITEDEVADIEIDANSTELRSTVTIIDETEEISPEDLQKARDKQSKRLYAKYGITLEQKEELYELQKGKCACCNESFEIEDLVVDHDHTTSLVRGLLCSHDNLMLGHARDSIRNLNNAIAYLEESRKYTITKGKKSVVLTQNIYE